MQQPTFYSPGKRQLRIVNLQGGESIGIYDTLGRQRASRKAYGESEEFELESGVYMIRIEGSSLIKGKVVVKYLLSWRHLSLVKDLLASCEAGLFFVNMEFKIRR